MFTFPPKNIWALSTQYMYLEQQSQFKVFSMHAFVHLCTLSVSLGMWTLLQPCSHWSVDITVRVPCCQHTSHSSPHHPYTLQSRCHICFHISHLTIYLSWVSSWSRYQNIIHNFQKKSVLTVLQFFIHIQCFVAISYFFIIFMVI